MYSFYISINIIIINPMMIDILVAWLASDTFRYPQPYKLNNANNVEMFNAYKFCKTHSNMLAVD